MNIENLLLAFLLTLAAGLSTGIGSIFTFFIKITNKKFLSFSLGLSAGVMIYVSMIEIFPKANLMLSQELTTSLAYIFTTISFFLGVFLISIIDSLVPSMENPHEFYHINNYQDNNSNSNQLQNISFLNEHEQYSRLKRSGIFIAIAIAIHNFPEGLATFISTIQNSSIGISIAVAIAIHNIPEGIAIAIPLYYSTNNKIKAIIWSFLSGLAEPIGATIGFFILYPFMNDIIFGVIFASVGGIMIFISLDELLPSAEKFGAHHISIYGLITGMIIMAISLIMFKI